MTALTRVLHEKLYVDLDLACSDGCECFLLGDVYDKFLDISLNDWDDMELYNEFWEAICS